MPLKQPQQPPQENLEPALEAVAKGQLETNELLKTQIAQSEQNNPSKAVEAGIMATKKAGAEVAEAVKELKPDIQRFADMSAFVEGFLKSITGPQGPTGSQGDKGDKGDDGKTPVKGEDYWTEEDQTEIYGDVIEFIESRMPTMAEKVLGEFAEQAIDEIGEEVQKNSEIFIEGRLPELLRNYEPEVERVVIKEVTKYKPKDGKDGKDGRDGSPDTGQQIVSKLDALEGDERLSWYSLKNRPVVTNYVNQMSDVYMPTEPSNGQALVWDSTMRRWKAGDATGGALTFLELTDTPSSYTGEALKVLRVNAGETGLEFITLAGGGDALTTDPLSQFAATTSAQLAGVISDETGTGALVFANSPVFTTPNIGSATGSITGNAGTATALQNARTIGGVSFDGTANIVPNTVNVVSTSGDTTSFFCLVDSETGELQIKTDINLKWNATSNILEIDGPAHIGGNLRPVTNDGGSLGTSTVSWSDLFLAEGAVINWDNGDMTMTQTGNQLDIDGGVVDFGSSPTVNGAGIYFASGTDVALADGGTGASLSDPNADRIMFWDDSAGQVTWLEVGSGLSISGTTLTATGGGGVPTQITVADEPTDTTCFPLFVTAATGDLAPKTNSNLAFNATSGLLTVGRLTVTSNNFTIGSSLPFSDSAGTLTLQNIDALDATTEATIEAAIDTLANLTSIQGQAVTLSAPLTLPADPNADRLFFWDDSAGATAYLTPGNGLTITTTTIAVDSASDTVDGIVELATAAETTTGTDATRAVTPDGFAGSDYGKRVVNILVSDPNGSAITTGDGKACFRVPSVMNGWNLVAVSGALSTVSSSGLPTFQVRRSRRTNATTRANADMLTTKLSIDASEFDSVDATTAAVIDTANDDVNTGDMIYIDIDVAGTGAKGLVAELTFQLP